MKITNITAGLCALLVSLSSTFAFAAPDVSAALTEWVDAVQGGKAERVVALYDKDAIMFSTFATAPMKTQASRLAYYKKVMAEPDVKVDVTESHPRASGNIALNSGLYTLSYTQEGEQISIPARFSFAYILKGNKWVIVDHHSSRVPLPDEVK